MNYDAIIVGGGPSGLSAALMLGRSRRKVLVCDSGHYRNAASHGAHGYLTRDGINPGELLRLAREELVVYGVEYQRIEVEHACAHEGGFRVTLANGTDCFSRKLLLATGVKDKLPEIEGIEPLYGKSVHHCPYCDGWEHRDQPIAVYGRKQHGHSLALSLKNWSDDVILVTDGQTGLSAQQRADLARLHIPVQTKKIARLEGTEGKLERIVFVNGQTLEREAMFFSTGQNQGCDLTSKFGCIFTNKGAVRTSMKQETNVPGLYVAGDASFDVQFVIVAAAEGAKAGQAMNEALMLEDRQAAS